MTSFKTSHKYQLGCDHRNAKRKQKMEKEEKIIRRSEIHRHKYIQRLGRDSLCHHCQTPVPTDTSVKCQFVRTTHTDQPCGAVICQTCAKTLHDNIVGTGRIQVKIHPALFRHLNQDDDIESFCVNFNDPKRILPNVPGFDNMAVCSECIKCLSTGELSKSPESVHHMLEQTTADPRPIEWKKPFEMMAGTTLFPVDGEDGILSGKHGYAEGMSIPAEAYTILPSNAYVVIGEVPTINLTPYADGPAATKFKEKSWFDQKTEVHALVAGIEVPLHKVHQHVVMHPDLVLQNLPEAEAQKVTHILLYTTQCDKRHGSGGERCCSCPLVGQSKVFVRILAYFVRYYFSF